MPAASTNSEIEEAVIAYHAMYHLVARRRRVTRTALILLTRAHVAHQVT